MSGRGAYQKKRRNVLNVQARHELLLNGISSPSTFDRALLSSLDGQRAFASLSVPKLNITPIALNTIKSISDELFKELDAEGRKGFAYLNALRLQLGSALLVASNARKVEAQTRRVENKTNQLTDRLQASAIQIVKQQKAYLSLYQAVDGLIKNGKLPPEIQMRLYRLLENHNVAFADLFESPTDSGSDIGPQVAQILQRAKKAR